MDVTKPAALSDDGDRYNVIYKNNGAVVVGNEAIATSTGFLSRLKRDPGYRMRILHTACVVLMFLTLGWSVSIVGSTFPDLRLIIKKDLDTASWLFTLTNLGYLVGALGGGVLFDRVNRLLMLTTVTSLSGVAVACIPWCTSFPSILCVSFMNGLFNGGMDVGGNSHVASMWGQQSAPFMQSIHFGFSFGAFISPLTADPFLAGKYCTESARKLSVGDLNNISISSTQSSPLGITLANISNTTACNESFGETKIHYAFLITGIMSLIAASPFFVLYLLSSKHKTYIDSVDANAEREEGEAVDGTSENYNKEKGKTLNANTNNLPDLPLSRKVIFVSALMVLISLYASAEGRFSGLLTTFVTEHLGWSTSDSLHVTSVFWGTFSGGRLFGILVTKYLKPATMVALYLVAVLLAFVGFYFAAIYHVTTLIWVCSALIGLFMSVIFPSIFTWTAESILTVTGKISATYLVGVSVSNMLFPLLFGYLMDNYTQMYFIDLLIAGFVICIGLYIVIRLMIRAYINPFRQMADSYP